LACYLHWYQLDLLEQKEAQSSHTQIFQHVAHDSGLEQEMAGKDILAAASDWEAQGQGKK
jgi:hypothetical protein